MMTILVSARQDFIRSNGTKSKGFNESSFLVTPKVPEVQTGHTSLRLNTVITKYLQYKVYIFDLIKSHRTLERQSMAIVREKRAEARAKKAKKSVNEEDSQTHMLREMEINV